MTFLDWAADIDVAIVCLVILGLLCIVGAIGWWRSHHTLDEFDQPWIAPRPHARTRETPRMHEPARPHLYDQEAR